MKKLKLFDINDIFFKECEQFYVFILVRGIKISRRRKILLFKDVDNCIIGEIIIFLKNVFGMKC